jgi:SOUL heme-binding protein
MLTQQHDLTTKLAADKVEVVHDEWITVWASYDSPFQLFDRHNEVWVHVKASGNSSTGSFSEQSDWGNTFAMME